MINYLRTLSARVLTRWLRRTRALVVRAWFWLAAHTDSLDERRRCLEAVLELEPDNELAHTALQALDPLNEEVLTYLYARRTAMDDSKKAIPRFSRVREVSLDELRTHPDLIERVSIAAGQLQDVQEGIVLGYYVLADAQGRVFAVAMSMDDLALRLGPTASCDTADVPGGAVQRWSEEWKAIDPWNIDVPEDEWIGTLGKLYACALEYTSELNPEIGSR